MIGIVGGMGPVADLEFEKQLLVATRKRLRRQGTVGLLATTGTLQSKLYQDASKDPAVRPRPSAS